MDAATASQEGRQEQGQCPGPPMGAGLSADRQGPSLPSQESQAEDESELKKNISFHFE